MGNIWIPLLLALLAGLSTSFGSLISFLIKSFNKNYLHLSLGFSAGIMIYVSLVEMLPEAIESIGFFQGNLVFFLGVGMMMLIDNFIPHEYIIERLHREGKDKAIMGAGIFTALGVAIHNFPEGIAVFVTSLENMSIGLPLAVAIAIHNIPEGIAVAMPIYYATKSRRKAFYFSFLSGLAEPLGAILAAVILFPFISTNIINCCLAMVGGVMIYISFDELLPLCFKDKGSQFAVFGILLGMMVMAFSLSIL